MKLKNYLGVVSLILFNSFHFAYADPAACAEYENYYKIAENLCNGSESATNVCSTGLGWTPFLGLLCAIPGAAAQTACDIKDARKQTYDACVVFYANYAVELARDAASREQGMALAQAELNPLIERYAGAAMKWDTDCDARFKQTFDHYKYHKKLHLKEVKKELLDAKQSCTIDKKFYLNGLELQFRDAYFLHRHNIEAYGFRAWDTLVAECIADRPPGSGGVNGKCLRQKCRFEYKDVTRFPERQSGSLINQAGYLCTDPGL